MQNEICSPAWTETERLAALERYSILDTPREQDFDDVVELVCQMLDAPIGAINLIAEGRQWFKAEVGLGVREMPLDDSICKHAILQEDCMIVPDTTQDPRFQNNPLVTAGPGLRFYAGEVLKSADGYPLGTICVLDTRPRPEGLTPQQRLLLKTLSRQIMAQLELRHSLKERGRLLEEKTAVERELRAERDQGRQVLEGMDEGFVLVDREFRVLQINSGALALAKRSKAEILGRTLWEAWPGLEALPLGQAYKRSLQGQQRVALEQKYTCQEGGSLWLDVRATPSPSGLAIFYRDITERKEAEEALRASEQRLAAAFSQASVGMAELSVDGVFIRVNDAFCKLLNRNEAQLRQMSFLDVTASIDAAESRYSVQRALELGEPLRLEKRYRRPDGQEFWATTNAARILDASGRAQGFIAVVIDITQRKRAEEELQSLAAELAEANRRQTEFLATLAHELRNPLAPIRSGIEVMRLAAGKPEVVKKMQGMLERQINHMVHLIDDLLDVARINSGKLELRKERTTLQKILASAVETSMPLIEENRHEFVVDLPDEPLVVHVDCTRIAQVVSNLLNNAAKYTPAGGGRIELSACRERNEAVVSVTDNGLGLPPEALSAIFEMFTQVRNPEQAQSGLGIGLTLVRRLVEYHGGTVSVSSLGPGQGSTFTVRLPLAASAPHRELEHSLQHATPGGAGSKRLKILVVDDNQDAAQSLAVFLEIKGHAVRMAHGGQDALQAAQEMRPDLVFLDIGMPGMDGYQVAKALRASEQAREAMLVALTGWGSESDRARSLRAGFNYHLTKPAPPAQLESILSSLHQLDG